jgi:integrase/recombinase XerC
MFIEYLGAANLEYGDPLADENARDYAVRDFKGHLKTVLQAKPTSVNLALAAVDHFYRFVGMGPPRVRREELPQVAPAALPREAQIAFLRAVERRQSERDRAIAMVLYHTGIRASECAALNVDDVLVSARKGKLVVRFGKGDAYREIPLNAEARRALRAWTESRGQTEQPALFLNKRGGRLSTRSVYKLINDLGKEAGLDISTHTLRHTCLTNLVRNGNDLVLVAELAGHRRLETTRRYSLPSAADRQAAMDALQIEY